MGLLEFLEDVARKVLSTYEFCFIKRKSKEMKYILWDCVNDYVAKREGTAEMMCNKQVWKKKPCCVDQRHNKDELDDDSLYLYPYHYQLQYYKLEL